MYLSDGLACVHSLGEKILTMNGVAGMYENNSRDRSEVTSATKTSNSKMIPV